MVVSAVMAFWAGVGGSVVLPIPPIKNVGISVCSNFTKSCGEINSTAIPLTTITTMSSMTTTEAPPEDYQDLLVEQFERIH